MRNRTCHKMSLVPIKKEAVYVLVLAKGLAVKLGFESQQIEPLRASVLSSVRVGNNGRHFTGLC